ncbi:MAG: glycoside hydrolase family 16 protein [Acidomyces sp. 'richmondensis']|nr:MAG: glycoside hydrolase family 16 protein [Acidomyces sp. 'richmondensis']
MRVGVVFATLGVCAGVLADCECGHTINSTVRFMESLETTFSQTTNTSVTWSSEAGIPWRAQQYNVTPAAARGPYGKAAELRNVIVSEDGLQLWVRSQLLDDGIAQLVPMAEVVTARNDMLYGSFRVGMKTTSVNGTCGAFFFYHNNSEEIDMEFLSREQRPNEYLVNLVNQSPESVASGYNAVNTSDYMVYHLGFSPSQGFHEYRFDWLPDRIDLYADEAWLTSFYQSVPSNAGALHLINWSNGDPTWSGGPPKKDAVLTVAYVNAYFNTTTSQQQLGSCPDPTGTGSTCPIPTNTSIPVNNNPPRTSSTVPTHSGGIDKVPNPWNVLFGLTAVVSCVIF